jgi:hypothetical protein
LEFFNYIGSSLFFLTLYRAKRVQVVKYMALMEDETEDLNLPAKYGEILHFRKNNLFNLGKKIKIP